MGAYTGSEMAYQLLFANLDQRKGKLADIFFKVKDQIGFI